MEEMIIECLGCGTRLRIPPEGNRFECPGCGQHIEIERGTDTKKLPRGPEIIACPDCGGKLSTEAIECPHCGYDTSGTETEYKYPEFSKSELKYGIDAGRKIMNPAPRPAGNWIRSLELPLLTIAGTFYRLENSNIISVIPIWKWDIKLIREPNNQYDPRAIAIYICGLHIGYVDKESTEDLENYDLNNLVVYPRSIHRSKDGKSYDIDYSLYQVAQPVTIACPECGQRAKVNPDDFGKEFNCAACFAKLKVGKKKGGKNIYYPPETPENGEGEYFRQVVTMQKRRKLFAGLLGFAFALIFYAGIPFVVWKLLGGIAGVIALAFCAWCFFQYLFSQIKGE